MSNANRILAALVGVRETKDGWAACCPAHDDKRPSLSVSEGSDGRVLLHCFAGCRPEAIVGALGLAMSDLFPEPPARRDRPTNRKIVATYPYEDEHGAVLYEVCRFEPKDFRQRRPDGNGNWIWSVKGIRPVPYNLPQVLGAAKAKQPVFVVEGEKDADALIALGLIATTSVGGAGKWRSEYSQHFLGAHVVIAPDNDQSGRLHAEQVARSLHGVAASVRILQLPDLPEKGDVSDWIAAGGTREELERLVAEAPEPDSGEPTSPALTLVAAQTQHLVALADVAQLFHTPNREAWMTFPVGSHFETAKITTQSAGETVIGRWLTNRYHRAYSRVPRAQALADALSVLAAKAIHEAPEREVALRAAQYQGAIFIDLGCVEWKVIELTAAGWRLIADPPVKFWRPPNFGVLPEPISGGTIQSLRPFVNVASADDFIVLVCWLLSAVRPTGPYPILVFQGEQGSAKSTTASILRKLVDPVVKAATRALPRSERDLAIATQNAHALMFSNVSTIDPLLSDALCRISTGEGYTTRRLYSDDAEVVFDGARPILIEGIGGFTSRPDLLDRAFVVSLPPILPTQRKSKQELLAAFDLVYPEILGALCDCVSAALRESPTTRIRALPRMADAARWVVACRGPLGWSKRRILRVLTENERVRIGLGLDASPIADAIRRWAAMDPVETWVGNASDLLEAVQMMVSDHQRRAPDWPKNAQAFATRLRRIAPNLRAIGIDVSFDHREGKGRARNIRIEVAPRPRRPSQLRPSEMESRPPASASESRKPALRKGLEVVGGRSGRNSPFLKK